MKLSKVIFSGLFAVSLVFGFASCSEEDDPNDMLKEVNQNNYTIEYTNDGTETSRGYITTNLKHAGAIVKINFEPTSSTNGGVMGVIFDYHDNATNGKDFYVIGIQNTTATEPRYYISKFEGVTNLQKPNFGAPSGKNAGTAGDGTNDTTVGTKETVIEDAFTSVPSGVTDTSSGTTLYVYYVEKATSETDYDFEVYFLPKTIVESLGDIKDADLGALKDKDGNVVDISSYKVKKTIDSSYTSLQQNKFGVYGNVYAGKNVKGSWTIVDTYKEADVVED